MYGKANRTWEDVAWTHVGCIVVGHPEISDNLKADFLLGIARLVELVDEEVASIASNARIVDEYRKKRCNACPDCGRLYLNLGSHRRGGCSTLRRRQLRKAKR